MTCIEYNLHFSPEKRLAAPENSHINNQQASGKCCGQVALPCSINFSGSKPIGLFLSLFDDLGIN